MIKLCKCMHVYIYLVIYFLLLLIKLEDDRKQLLWAPVSNCKLYNKFYEAELTGSQAEVGHC